MLYINFFAYKDEKELNEFLQIISSTADPDQGSCGLFSMVFFIIIEREKLLLYQVRSSSGSVSNPCLFFRVRSEFSVRVGYEFGSSFYPRVGSNLNPDPLLLFNNVALYLELGPNFPLRA